MTTTTRPVSPSGLNIPGFDAQGKSTWLDGRRLPARTSEEKSLRDRQADFNAVWWSCWHYFSEHVGGEVWRTDEDGIRERVSWEKPALLYNFFLRKAQGLERMRFRLSDAGMTNQDVMHAARLKDKRAMSEAKKTLTLTGLVRITDESDRGADYTVELMQPPARRGKPRKLSAATITLGYVSGVDNRLKTIDHTAEIDRRIIADLLRNEG
jgi:hypothetical protein